jgi:hypothetical protein
MRLGRYKVTPALIVTILLALYMVLHLAHCAGVFRQIIKNNSDDSKKEKPAQKPVVALIYYSLFL